MGRAIGGFFNPSGYLILIVSFRNKYITPNFILPNTICVNKTNIYSFLHCLYSSKFDASSWLIFFLCAYCFIYFHTTAFFPGTYLPAVTAGTLHQFCLKTLQVHTNSFRRPKRYLPSISSCYPRRRWRLRPARPPVWTALLYGKNPCRSLSTHHLVQFSVNKYRNSILLKYPLSMCLLSMYPLSEYSVNKYRISELIYRRG